MARVASAPISRNFFITVQHIDSQHDLFMIGMKSLTYLKTKGTYRQVLHPLHVTAEWASTFLCNPHVELGRNGAVCPFTRPSIDKELFWLSLYIQPASQPAQIARLMLKYRDVFLQLDPQTGREVQYKTILVVFPHFSPQDCTELIDQVQRELKPEFVSKGLMIGQFHAGCQEPGLWNRNFRPLQSPLPMLVIRNMVISDYPFLEHDKNLVKLWAKRFSGNYKSYLKKLNNVV